MGTARASRLCSFLIAPRRQHHRVPIRCPSSPALLSWLMFVACYAAREREEEQEVCCWMGIDG